MVATSQPLAAQAGMQVLMKGGNAADAAVAAAAALTVVAPTVCGIGGDLVALVSSKGEQYVLNGTGRSPQALSAEVIRAAGHDTVPRLGALAVTVPGLPKAWADLVRRFGRLSLSAVLEPAISYAEDGYPVNALSAHAWRRYSEIFSEKGKDYLANWFQCFAASGRTPIAGEIWKSAAHGRTLRAIAETDAEIFYRGDMARALVAAVRKFGGVLTEADLAAHESHWDKPISAMYRGYTVSQAPPNSQGLVSLVALRILDKFPPVNPDSAAGMHLHVEAVKQAFSVAYDCVARNDRRQLEELLADDEIDRLMQRIDPSKASDIGDIGPKGGTVCVVAADRDGTVVSLLQSNFYGFGSGVVVPDSGIALNCRACAFSMDPMRSDFVAGGTRPFHTLAPVLVSQGEELVGAMGIIGASMQPQGHVQLLSRMLDVGLNPQAAIDAPRWEWEGGSRLAIEDSAEPSVVERLKTLGHDAVLTRSRTLFGRAQVVLRDPGGTFIGGTDYRAEGQVAAW